MSEAHDAAPLVSVLVVTYREHQLLGRCLASLQRATDGLSIETIVVVNGVPLQAEHREAEAAGALLVTAPFNLGFPGGLHVARDRARGRYLAILQDDVEVPAGWLEPLIEVLDDNPSVGAVTSRVEQDGGGIEHEGMLVWRDAFLSALGDPARPGARRPVDAGGSAALLVRAEAWDAVGGPDYDLFPTWWVDIDFCVSLARAGWNVMVEPRSVSRHGVHTSTSGRMREYLNHRHKPRILQRHAVVFDARPPWPGPSPDAEAELLARIAADAEVRRSAPRPDPACFHREPMPVDRLIPHLRGQARSFRAGFLVWRARQPFVRVRRKPARLIRRSR